MYCTKDGCLNQAKSGSNYCTSHQPKVMATGMHATIGIGSVVGAIGGLAGSLGKAVKSDDPKKSK